MGMTPEVIFGERLRAEREQLRWSQADLGDRLRQIGTTLHQTQIARIELGQRSVRLNEATALAHVLNVPIEDLVSPSHGAAPPAEENAELDEVEELERQIEGQRKKLSTLAKASAAARWDMQRAQEEKDQALRALELAMMRLSEASVTYREVEKQLSEALQRIDELNLRLRLRVQDDLEEKENTAARKKDGVPEVGGADGEINIPYGDSNIAIRVERTTARKWIYVVIAGDGSEILRSGDFSSEHGAVSARDIMIRKILHEKRRIEDLTGIEKLAY